MRIYVRNDIDTSSTLMIEKDSVSTKNVNDSILTESDTLIKNSKAVKKFID